MMNLFVNILLFQFLVLVPELQLVQSKPADTETKTAAAAAGPPSFFLQDPSDSLCLAGETFKRCSIDTLFYVVGNPGSYQIHKRPTTDEQLTADNNDDNALCIAKKSCKDTDYNELLPIIMSKCTHCGAKRWNVLGDTDTGYVLTEGPSDDEKDGDSAKKTTCLFRQGNVAMTGPCDSSEIKYTPLQLRFASPNDIRTMSSTGARMIGAASDGDLSTIQKLLEEEKVDINVRDWDELTALIPAASAGNKAICEYLISKGIDVNAADKDGITALMEASIMGHSAVVQYLIEQGATVDAEASSSVTALWLAASEGQMECMKILLRHGASATNTRADGITALMTAAVGGHAEAVQLLIAEGADPTTVDKEGLTPLMNAAENGTVPILKVLGDAAKNNVDYINQVSTSGFNAFIIAAAHGHVEAVEYLLSVGASINSVAPDNKVTALMFAAASNHVGVVRLLIEKGCDIEMQHSNGGTALVEAATGGAVDTMRVLIEKGAKVDTTDDDGVTPLMAIASQGNSTGVDIVIESLQKLYNNDANKLKEFINLFSKSGGSAVMFATAGGHANVTRKLIALGADINASARATPDYVEKLHRMKAEGTSNELDEHVDGVTALHVAAQAGHLDAVNVLIEHNVDVTMADDNERTALLLAIKGNYGDVAQALVKAGGDPNTSYTDDEDIEHNLLFDAVMVENANFAILLIEKGADIYYFDDKKVSTLLQASHRGLVNVTKAILEKHATNPDPKYAIYIDAPSDEGISPLIAASSEGKDEVVQLLVQHKANVNVKDQDLTTPLMAAAARGHEKVVKILLEAGATVNEQNTDGHTALMFAYNGKNQVETLWERYTQYVNEAKATKTKKGEIASGSSSDDVDDNGTGTIIREALDKHLELITLLLKYNADTSLKDNEGHTAKDFDYHPDLDENYISKSTKNEKLKDESKYEL